MKATDKINKLAKQHEVIGTKTDCPYFNTVGNLCSRTENGMMRCDEYLEYEFKYIDALKEENEQLKALCDTYFTCYRAKHNDIEGNLFSYRKALKEIREIIQTFPNKNSSLDWEAKAHRAIEIVKQINEVLKDEQL